MHLNNQCIIIIINYDYPISTLTGSVGPLRTDTK